MNTMKIKMWVVTVGIVAMGAAGCGAATEPATEVESDPTPAPTATATPGPGALAQLHPANAAGVTARGADSYEPNDAAAYYLGAGTDYTVMGYIDPVDVNFTVDVANDGTAAASSFDVMLKVGATTMVQTVDAVVPGESKLVTFAMADTNPGTVSGTVEVDSGNDVEESDEADNASAPVDVVVAGDEDRYSVYQFSGGTLGVTLDQLPADYDVQLLNPNGVVVASSANGALNTETISTTANMSGEWVVRVIGYQGARSGTYPYRLRITAP